MTQNLEILTRQSDTLNSIRSIVHTMKTLSAINAVPYEHAARSIDGYHATILRGFAAFLHRNGPLKFESGSQATRVIVVFGSDHGLCGNYNETLATDVSIHLETLNTEKPDVHVVCIGAQMHDALNAQGVKVQSFLMPPASADGIGRLAGDLVTRLDEIRRQSVKSEIFVTLAFTKRAAHGRNQPAINKLLPLDPELFKRLETEPWISRSLPQFTLPPGDLFAALIRSHIFASVFRAAAEALVTENAARFSQMKQAEQSVDDRLLEVKSETRTVRQSEITTEILDVIMGFEALKKRKPKSRQSTERAEKS